MVDMKRWYDASAGIVEAANSAMREIADSHQEDMHQCIRDVWEPIANALAASTPDDLDLNWSKEAKIIKDMGPDYVGMTSDTRAVITWGEDHGTWREFVFATPGY